MSLAIQVGNDLMHGQVRVDFGGLGRSAVLLECPVLVEHGQARAFRVPLMVTPFPYLRLRGRFNP